ncbi:uncharacterized protein LOC124171561 [Ischnura elegans]|uniref:uncharacterized protein LOC124171561 n=1 Tax=Ischnura elegans TaxID=197161 RepID=UPI001ED8888E|nr:uncharacterized protein LOC124171561 [Ischnura elegans]
MAGNGETFRTPRKPTRRGSSSRGGSRPTRPYSPRPPSSGKFRPPSYKPSCSPDIHAIEEEARSSEMENRAANNPSVPAAEEEAKSPQSQRPRDLGVVECAYRLNFCDTKRVSIGLDLKNACFPFIAIAKVGGQSLKIDYSDFCDLMKCESVVASYFYRDTVPHAISFGKTVLKFKSTFGIKSIVLEDVNSSHDNSGVYLAKTSWYGLLNLAECVRLRWEERCEWSPHAQKILDMYADSIFNAVDREEGENRECISWEQVTGAKVNLDEITDAPPSLNIQAIAEEIHCILKTHEGKKILVENIAVTHSDSPEY